MRGARLLVEHLNPAEGISICFEISSRLRIGQIRTEMEDVQPPIVAHTDFIENVEALMKRAVAISELANVLCITVAIYRIRVSGLGHDAAKVPLSIAVITKGGRMLGFKIEAFEDVSAKTAETVAHISAHMERVRPVLRLVDRERDDVRSLIPAIFESIERGKLFAGKTAPYGTIM